ncbi:MAG: squalene--hopene cyclase [Planctomycetia bacterium]
MGPADPERSRCEWIEPWAAGPTVADGLPEPEEGQPFDRWLQHSSPFTLSLSLHVIILLVLALVITRGQRIERFRLDLAFGPEQGAGPLADGLAVEQETAGDEKPDDAQPAPEAEPEPEMASMPPKPDTIATTDSPPAPDPDPKENSPTPDDVVESPSVGGAPTVRFLLTGRSPGRRDALLEAGGGGGETETAVALALEWLVRNQEKSGLWSLRGPYLDGSRQENRLAATAMALLALQGAGNSTRDGAHRDAVRKGWTALLSRQSPNGTFDIGQIPEQQVMYAHAQATIALCELYGMTGEVSLQAAAQRAVDYAVAAQMPDGGWKYRPPEPNSPNHGDMSVTGWYMMALKTAEMAGLSVPRETYGRMTAFLDAVFVSDDKGYGYEIMRQKHGFQIRPALTAEALLCRQYLGWRRDDPKLVAGAALLLREVPKGFDYPDVYAWYYATQVLHHMEGEPWRQWNDWMRTALPESQVDKGREKGSWSPSNDKWGYVGGRLFMTCLCTCMLEVYYRHLALHATIEEAPRPAAPPIGGG